MAKRFNLKTFLSVLLIVFLVPIVCPGQQSQVEKLPSLLKKIQASPPDTTRVSLLLKVAFEYIRKPGELQTDMDSARILIKQAELLSKNIPVQTQILRGRFLKGLVLLEQYNFVEAKKVLVPLVEDYKKIGDLIESAHVIYIYAYYLPRNHPDKKIFIRKAELAYQEALGPLERKLETDLNASKPSERQVDSLLTLSYQFVSKPGEELLDLGKAMLFATKGLEVSRELNYTNGIYDAQFLIALTYKEKGDIEKTKSYLAFPIDSLVQMRILFDLGSFYFYKKDTLGNRDSAKFYFDRANNFAAQLKRTTNNGLKHLNYTRLWLTRYYYLKKDYRTSLSLAFNLVESLSKTTDSTYLHITYSSIGDIYITLKENDKALENHLMALQFCNKKDITSLYAVLHGVSRCFQNLNRPTERLNLIKTTLEKYPAKTEDEKFTMYRLLGDAYASAGQLNLAESNYKEMLRRMPASGNNRTFGSYSFGTFCFKMGDYRLAKLYVLQALNSRGTTFNDRFLSNIYQTLFKIDSAVGNYRSAMEFHTQYKKFSDSYYEEQMVDAVREIEVKYETEKKDNDIQLLRQQGELQEAKLDQSHFARNISIGGAAVLLFIAGLLYYLFQTKQKSNKQLTHLLDEKEWLLKEIHHRVKNNLQTVLSLLESQSRKLSNEAFDALQESQNRVYAMSLIHKKLYQSTDVSSINAEDYLRDLVQHLRDSFGSSGNIRFSLQLDSVILDVSQAVPVGLIVNEAVTNSIKYAFPNGRQNNEISISLKYAVNNRIVLLITDNGVGISSLQENSQSLGLKLIRGLTEDIDGVFSIESNHGVTIIIEFVANIPFQMIAKTVPPTLVMQSA